MRMVVGSLTLFLIYLAFLSGFIHSHLKKKDKQMTISLPPRHRHPEDVRRKWGEITESQEIADFRTYMPER